MKEYDDAARGPVAEPWLALAGHVERTLQKAQRQRLIDGYRRDDQTDHVSLTIIGLQGARRRLAGAAQRSRRDAGDFHVRISNTAGVDFLIGEVGVTIQPVGFDEAHRAVVERVTPQGFTHAVQTSPASFQAITDMVAALIEESVPLCRREARRAGGSPLLNGP